MIRLLLRLLGIKDYEICKSCETLKEQLSFERSEKKQLTDTLLDILSPKVVEAAPVVLAPFAQTAGTFGRRRAILEAKDREVAKILTEANYLGKPDLPVNPRQTGIIDNIIKSDYVGSAQIQNLEYELGIEKEA